MKFEKNLYSFYTTKNSSIFHCKFSGKNCKFCGKIYFPTVFPLKITVGKSEGGKWDFPLFRCVVGNFPLFSHQTFLHKNFPQPMCSGKNFPLLINTVEKISTILKVRDLPLFSDCTVQPSKSPIAVTIVRKSAIIICIFFISF